MAKAEMIDELARIFSHVVPLGIEHLWMDYDEEADVLYLTFQKPAEADDSELREDGIIVRYKGNDVVGMTIPNATKRTLKG